MDVIELSYKKPNPIPNIQLGLYRAVDSDYVEVNGGGYKRQKYTGGAVKFPQATGDWGKIHALGLHYKGKLTIKLLNQGFTIHAGDQFNLSLDVEKV